MSWKETIMELFGFRPVRPPIAPTLKTTEDGLEFEKQLRSAVQHHKDVANQSIKHSFDVIDNIEHVRMSLKSIFDRATVPGEASIEGGYELISGRKRDDADP
jgi:hypothetical protein